MDYEDEGASEAPITENGTASEEKPGNPPISEEDAKLVKRLLKRVEADRAHHEKAFKRMRDDMVYARVGATKEWVDGGNYTANITGRHIRQQVSTLYAKNPKAVARRRPRLDFQVWDEDEQSLVAAMQIVQQFHLASAAAAAADPLGAAMGVPQIVPPEVMQAQALVEDFQAGMAERQTIDKVGKTLDVLFSYFMNEQKPVAFKTAMKQLVRRTCTTGVGYCEIGFQRAYEDASAAPASGLADVRGQLAHGRSLAREVQNADDAEDVDAKERELALTAESLQNQEYVLAREGLVFDFPESTHVIPDCRTRNLTGFVGARWLTIQYLYTPDEVRGLFGVDLGRDYRPYSQDGKHRDDPGMRDGEKEAEEYACVLKHYDRQSGQCYYLCDGYKGFLRPPAPPDVYVEDFWPVYALTFNEGEDDQELFPPSDVALLRDMQNEYNRSRQGKREHRKAARPRFATRRGSLDDEDKKRLGSAEPFEVVEVNPQGDQFDIAKEIQAVPMPGVDPNLYDVGETYTDMQLVVGTSPTGVGATPRSGTATGEALAEDSRTMAAGSSADDLDAFLSAVARASGQVLLREMSAESVRKIAGRGAVWPEMTLEDIAGEIYLEIEAGSTGKPNAAQEIRNWREMLPFLLQMPGIEPTWLARESLRRLDDRLDLTDAIAQGLPSIMTLNRSAQVGPADPGAAPEDQGGEGGGNGGSSPSRPTGGERGMGSNHAGPA
ncbi:hypothetical protein [Thauera sp.]|uniref:hypothetical protein n=1 Tax=Thauera sp. TaxID=1905334 RepID=UPI002B5E018A|nr:hypothetical protein [Thauera sp.]HRP25403.1 hypothetical protein [Thauera sp.]